MQMVHDLAGVLSGVGDDPVSPAIQTELAGHPGREAEQAAQHRLVVRVTHGRHVAGRDHQDVGWRAGIDVPERHRLLGALHDRRGDLARDDATK